MQVDFKTDGKNLKIFMVEEKPEKHSISHTLRKFCKACENPKYHFARGAKICTPCESQFAHPVKISLGMRKIRTPSFAKMLCEKLYEIREGVRTHFATLDKFRKPCVNSNSLCENQRSLKSLFKPLQALFSFRTPHLPIAKASITLRRLSFHSFSSLDASCPLIWRGNPHQTYGTQTRASYSISNMAWIREGHIDSSLSHNPRPRASSP